MNNKTTYSQRGFSLVEVVVAIVIVGILGSMSLVNLSRTVNSEKLRSTAKSLENWINEQRNIAMQSGHSCSIIINPTTRELTSQRTFASSPTGCSSTSQSPLSFDFEDLYGSDFNKLTVSVTPPPSLGSANSGVNFSYRGFSQNRNPASNDQLLIRLSTPDIDRQRCIKVVSPIGLIRDGYAADASSNCKFDGAF